MNGHLIFWDLLVSQKTAGGIEIPPQISAVIWEQVPDKTLSPLPPQKVPTLAVKDGRVQISRTSLLWGKRCTLKQN